jgi:ethanolamine utilization protein EutM
MRRGSLGLIETWGFTPAVVAADTGMKAANVRLISYKLTYPGRITITFGGDVAAVGTAVKAAAVAAAKVGRVISTHVIARPDTNVIKTFEKKSKPGVKKRKKAASSKKNPSATEKSGFDEKQNAPPVEKKSMPVKLEKQSEKANSSSEKTDVVKKKTPKRKKKSVSKKVNG